MCYVLSVMHIYKCIYKYVLFLYALYTCTDIYTYTQIHILTHKYAFNCLVLVYKKTVLFIVS